MNHDERFDVLWNEYIEGELDEDGVAELQALAAEDERRLSKAVDSYQLHRLLGLAAQDSSSRHDAFVRATMERLPAGDKCFTGEVMARLSRRRLRRRTAEGLPWLAAAVLCAVMLAFLYIQTREREQIVAKITGLGGYLQWTGDEGRVFEDLAVGAQLTGGTIAGMTPDTWCELEFTDGSTVMISGDSTLTFSDHGQKVLRINKGNLSANIKPQPNGSPMLIHTRSAVLEILGTQFEVEAELAATMLNVSEGTVRLKRLSDGGTITVPAQHRAVAAADRKMKAVAISDAVDHWRSQLSLGPAGTYGTWSPAAGGKEAKLRALPFTSKEGLNIYMASFKIARGNKPPVQLNSSSRFRVRGFLAKAARVWFGVTVQRPDGVVSGRFQIEVPAEEFHGGQGFEITLSVDDFVVVPMLSDIKDDLPKTPDGLFLKHMWCHSLGQQVGLEIYEVELIPPDRDGLRM